jgi:outer membrane protein assembly factor BamB
MRGDFVRILKSVAVGFAFTAAQIFVATQASWAAQTFVSSPSGAPTSAQSQYAVAYQINVGHSGNIAFTTPLTTPLKQAWSVNLGGTVSYPLIADSLVFAVVNQNELFALNLATGTTKWEKLLSGNWNAIAYDHGQIFDVNGGGQMIALNAETGKVKWDVSLPGQYSFSSPPTAQSGMVFTGGAGGGGTLYGVNEVTGKVVWTQFVQNGDDSSPALGDSGVYVTYPCQYYKFTPSTGASAWYYDGPCEGGGGATPVYFGGRLYVQDWTSGNYVFDAKTGTLLGAFAATPTPAFYLGSNGKSYMLSVTECSNGQPGCTLFSTRISTGNVA